MTLTAPLEMRGERRGAADDVDGDDQRGGDDAGGEVVGGVLDRAGDASSPPTSVYVGPRTSRALAIAPVGLLASVHGNSRGLAKASPVSSAARQNSTDSARPAVAVATYSPSTCQPSPASSSAAQLARSAPTGPVAACVVSSSITVMPPRSATPS